MRCSFPARRNRGRQETVYRFRHISLAPGTLELATSCRERREKSESRIDVTFPGLAEDPYLEYGPCRPASTPLTTPSVRFPRGENSLCPPRWHWPRLPMLRPLRGLP